MIRSASPALALSLALAASLALGGCNRRMFVNENYDGRVRRELAIDRYEEGVRFAEAGNTDLAVERFNRSLAISPRAAVYYALGQTYEKLDRKDEAKVVYLQAVELAPDYQEARLALLQLGVNPPSEEEMRADPALIKAFALESGLDLETAAEIAAKAAEEASKDALRQGLAQRADAAAQERIPTAGEVRAALFPATPGGHEEAMPSATEPTFAGGSEIILNTFAYHFANGQRFQRGQEYEKAATEYRAALEIEPTSEEARLNLGDVLLKLERFPQAQFHYLTAIEQFPNSARPLFKLGNYYESLRRLDLAREYYRQTLQRDPNHVEALNNMAALEIREKNFSSAVDYLQRVIKINPAYQLAYLNLGVSLENSGDKAGAIDAYHEYIELGGDQAPQVRVWIQELQR